MNKTPFAELNKIGTTLDEDLPLINQNTEIIDNYLKIINNELTNEVKTRIKEVVEIKQELREGIKKELESRIQGDELSILYIKEHEKSETAHGGLLKHLTRGDEMNSLALKEHEESELAHSSLLKRLTLGNTSPIIGVCLVQSNNGYYFCNVDEFGNPVAVNYHYFNNHPVYSGIRKVLIDGQMMVEIPSFYYKHMVVESGTFSGSFCKIISPFPKEGFKLYPAFYNKKGEPLSHIYIGASLGSKDLDKIGSKYGGINRVSMPIDEYKKSCEKRNINGVSGFHLWNIYEYSAICILFMLEYGTFNSYETMKKLSKKDSYLEWRHFEDLSCKYNYQQVDGLRVNGKNEIEVFSNDGLCTWINTGKLCTDSSGFAISLQTGRVKNFDFDDVFIPSEVTSDYYFSLTDNEFVFSSVAGKEPFICGIGKAYSDFNRGLGLFSMSLSINYQYGDYGRLAKH